MVLVVVVVVVMVVAVVMVMVVVMVVKGGVIREGSEKVLLECVCSLLCVCVVVQRVVHGACCGWCVVA